MTPRSLQPPGLTKQALSAPSERDAENYGASIISGARDAIYSLNLRGMITVWNRAAEQVYGYTADEVIGEDVSVLMPEANISDKETLLARIAAGESIENYVTRRTRKDGKVIDVALSISPIGNATDEIVGASVIARDVTEIVHSRAALERVNRSLSLIERCHRALINLNNERELCATVCRLISEIGGYSFVSIAYADQDDPTKMRRIAHFGAAPAFDGLLVHAMDGERVQTDAEVLSIKSLKEKRVVVFNDLAAEPASNPWRADALRNGFRSVAAFPLCGSTPAAIGSLSIYAAARNAFDDAAIADATSVADDLSLGIRNLRLRVAHEETLVERGGFLRQISDAFDATIAAMAAMIGMRDPYTADHQQRVGHLAPAIAHALGLSKDQITGVRLAAMIHDIGKIRVPVEILSRPGKLSADEFALIKIHAAAGFDVLKTVTFPWPIAEMVLQHHERLDGSGYPHGLTGSRILREAKIIAISDVVEAMCAHRPYRPALGIGAALDEITTRIAASFTIPRPWMRVSICSAAGGLRFEGTATPHVSCGLSDGGRPAPGRPSGGLRSRFPPWSSSPAGVHPETSKRDTAGKRGTRRRL